MTLRPIRRPGPSHRTREAWLRDAGYHTRLPERALGQLLERTGRIGGLDVAEHLAAVRAERVALVGAARISGAPRRDGLDGRGPGRRGAS